MKWYTWYILFCVACDKHCVFSVNDLLTAFKNGKTPQEIARANDALAAESDEGEYNWAA